MTIRWQPKRPAEERSYFHDWTPFLGTDTIASKVDVASGVTLDSVDIASGDRGVTFMVSGGTDGTVATVTQTITTAAGLVESETFLLPIGLIEEPLTLVEAKAQLRVLDDSEDAYIESLIPAARRYVEERSGIIVKRREFTEQHFVCRGVIRLFKAPLVSIDEVEYPDADGVATPYADARFFTGSSVLFPALGETWPSAYAGERFTVTYTAGLSPEQLGSDEYANLLHAMKLLIGHWFKHREAVSEGQANSIPMGVDALCDQVRLPVL